MNKVFIGDVMNVYLHDKKSSAPSPVLIAMLMSMVKSGKAIFLKRHNQS